MNFVFFSSYWLPILLFNSRLFLLIIWLYLWRFLLFLFFYLGILGTYYGLLEAEIGISNLRMQISIIHRLRHHCKMLCFLCHINEWVSLMITVNSHSFSVEGCVISIWLYYSSLRLCRCDWRQVAMLSLSINW